MVMGAAAAIAAVKRMQGALRRLASVPSRASAEASVAIASLIQQQFDSGTDPYGNAWADLKPATIAKGRTPPPLTDSRDMRDGVDVAPMQGAGIRVTFDVPYAAFHQTGTVNMPARKVMPERGLPPSWEQAIGEVVRAEFERTMGGAL